MESSYNGNHRLISEYQSVFFVMISSVNVVGLHTRFLAIHSESLPFMKSTDVDIGLTAGPVF